MKKARRIILVLITISNGSISLLAPIYAIFVEKLGGGILEAAGTYAIFSIVYGSLMIFIGRMTDKVKNMVNFLVVGFLLSALGFAGYLVAKNVIHLLIIQVILGTALAIMTPAWDALYTKHLDDGKAAAEWGVWEALWSIAGGVGAFIGGIIAGYVGFNILFVLMSAVSFFAGIYLLTFGRKMV